MSTPSLTRRPEWRILAEHHARIRDAHLRDLFAQDPGRGERLVAERPQRPLPRGEGVGEGLERGEALGRHDEERLGGIEIARGLGEV